MALPKTHKAYISFLQRLFRSLLILLLLSRVTFAQNINKLFFKDSTALYIKQDTVYLNKTIPSEFKDAILIALHYYPELKETAINFRVKKTISPLAARPRFLAIFRKPSKRKYIVTISNSTINKLTPILLQNLSFNSQVGVIGHELAHLSYYQTKQGSYFIKLVLMHLSKRAIDKFEFDTDKRCIDHVLGFQLLSWSIDVRAKLTLNQWGGANSQKAKRERYMNPETITKNMVASPLYQK